MHAELDSERQSLEASVIDVADDITYAFMTWKTSTKRVSSMAPAPQRSSEPGSSGPSGPWRSERQNSNVDGPGSTFAKLWAELGADYPSISRERSLDAAIRGARALIEGTVYAESFRGSQEQVAQLRSLTSEKITDCLGAVELRPSATAPSPWVALDAGAWHLVQVLKRLTRSFIIDRPDVALSQIGQQHVILELADALFQWAQRPGRLPVRLRDGLAGEGVADPDDSERPVIDFLAGLTDHQAYQLHAALRGSAAVPLTASFVL